MTSSALDLRWNMDPVAATSEGLSEYDDRYGNYTTADVAAHIAALRSVGGTLEATDADALEEEIDRSALLNDVRVKVNRLQHERPFERNPTVWLSHVLDGLYLLLVRSDRSPEHVARALRGRLSDIPRFLDEGRETLSGCPQVFVETALQVTGASGDLIDEVAAHPALPGGDETFQEDVCRAREALEGFEAFLRDDLLPAANENFAIGEDAFNFRLHYEHALSHTAPEVYRYGLRLVDEVESEIAGMAAAMGSSSLADLMKTLREEHPEVDGLVGAYEDEMRRAFEFVVERGLAAIPEGDLEVLATPSFLRPLVPFAAYQSPGTFSSDRRGLFFVTVPDEDIDARSRDLLLRDHCYHEIPATALHEGYPGHHLQILTAQGLPGTIRRMVSTPLTVEGWALYCEDMMAEEGFYRTPEELLFQKAQLLWRAVRVVVDVALHTRGMTFDEASDMLVDRAGLERSHAEAEVRRYCAYPGYQLSYAVGRREIRELRKDYQAAHGSAFSLSRFHEDLLAYGGLPVGLARWGMGLED